MRTDIGRAAVVNVILNKEAVETTPNNYRLRSFVKQTRVDGNSKHPVAYVSSDCYYNILLSSNLMQSVWTLHVIITQLGSPPSADSPPDLWDVDMHAAFVTFDITFNFLPIDAQLLQ